MTSDVPGTYMIVENKSVIARKGGLFGSAVTEIPEAT